MVTNWKSTGYLNYHMTDHSTALNAMIAFCNHVIGIYSDAHGIRFAKSKCHNSGFQLDLQIDINIVSFDLADSKRLSLLKSAFDMFMLGYLARADHSGYANIAFDNFGDFCLVEADDYWFWRKNYGY